MVKIRTYCTFIVKSNKNKFTFAFDNQVFHIYEAMSENQKVLKPSGKYLINLFFFFLSTVIIVSICPREDSNSLLKLIGSLILVSTCYIVLYLFLSHFRSEILDVTRKTFFIILIILSFVILTRIVISYTERNILFLIPFAIIPIVIHTFYDARLALFITPGHHYAYRINSSRSF